MNKSYCQIVSEKLSTIKKLTADFQSLYTTPLRVENISQLYEIKTRVLNIIKEFEETLYLPPEKIFIDELNKKEIQEKLRQVLHHFEDGNLPLKSAFLEVESIFSNLFTIRSLDSEAYAKVVEILSTEKNCSFLEFLNEVLPESENSSSREKFLACLNSVFLNKFLKAKDVITISSLPETLEDDFGCYLRRGNIRFELKSSLGHGLGTGMEGGCIETLSCLGDAGMFMSGGELRIAVAGEYLGNRMTGGKIVCKKCNEKAGVHMEGGEIVIEEALRSVGYEMSGGKIEVKEASDYAGWRMQGGVLNIDKAGGSLGVEMSGGTINVDRADRLVGSAMSGGRINIKKADRLLGSHMTGGVISVDEMGRNCGYSAMGGTIIADNAVSGLVGEDSRGVTIYCKHPHRYTGEVLLEGTMLIEESETEIDMATHGRNRIFIYNDKNKSYRSLGDEAAEVIDSDLELDSFINGRPSLCIINNISSNPTIGMKEGILVLREAPAGGIGVGMRGGILILEDPNLTEEEAKKRLAPKREGGVVMMRVRAEVAEPKKGLGRIFKKTVKTTLKEIV